MNTVIMDIMVYMVYVSIVIIISYGNRDPNMFLMKNNLETTLIHGGLRCGWTPDDEPCDKDEDLPFWDNPYNGRNVEKYKGQRTLQELLQVASWLQRLPVSTHAHAN